MRSLAALLLLCVAAVAQESVKSVEDTPKTGSITGVVTVSGTGAPMKDVQVIIGRGSPKEKTAVTDANGRYTLRDIAPGASLRIIAAAADSSGRIGGFGPTASRLINLAPGQDLAAMDFQLVIPGRIAGKVVDQNNEPVVGISVYLVARDYSYGALRAVFAGAGNTDDQGEYLLERVSPGRAYAVMAGRKYRPLGPLSDAPLDPALRLPAVVPTFYPNSRTPEGAEPLTLRPGERREGVDIHLARSPSFCLEGVLEGNSGPAAITFNISETQPASGRHGTGGFYMATPGGKSGPDGKIRLCDLHPGDYELSVSEYTPGSFGNINGFGAVVVNVSDRDLAGVRVGLRPRIPVSGEVVFDGPAPEKPLEQEIRVNVETITRTNRGTAQVKIPGEFSFEGGLPMDEFSVDFISVPSGIYVKDVKYGDRSILNRTMRVGTAMGNAGLTIVLGRDGGSIATNVADKDGNPVADCTVVILPATAENEAAFAAAFKNGQTDQSGRWTGPTMAPGKYVVLATRDIVNRSPETVAKLWKARARGEEVEIVAGGKPSAHPTLKSLD
ncbi:MAG: carboxypeptidase-like regulatory domain-containing protein [Candidatus Solibacter sp.]